MKFPRASLHIKRATGICVGESRLLVSVCRSAARGPKVVDAFEVAVGPGGPLEALRTLVNDPRIGGTIAFGFDPRREFSATMHLKPEEETLSVADLLTARLGRFEGGMLGAKVPLRFHGGPSGKWATVTALPRKPAGIAFETFASWKQDRLLLLPVAQQLHRAATLLARGPRKWRTKIRVVPSHRRGMAILSTGTHALAWRLFPWTASDPVGSIEGAVRMLANHAREELGIGTIDGVLIHCGPEHDGLPASCAEVLGLAVSPAAPMIVDESTIAAALAAGALARKPGDVNLFDELMPMPGLRSNFPLLTIAVLFVVMFGAAGLLYAEADRTSQAAARLEQKIQSDALGHSPQAKELDSARDHLKAEVDRAHNFIVDRVQWAPLLKELPDLLPPSLTLTSFDGRSALKGFGEERQSNGAKRAIIQGEVPFESDASSPPEVGMLTSRVVTSEVFKKTFPEVTGAKVRLKPGAGQDVAKIMVLCMPKGG